MESFSVRQLPSFGGVGGGPSYEISFCVVMLGLKNVNLGNLSL